MVNSSANYWIAANALKISLNALGDANRIQCGLATGSVIMCYIRGVDGLEYDNGHNYRRWPLTISPTFFNSDTEKYVYVAIPRTAEVGNMAQVVFPNEKIDIYGYVVDAEGQSTEERIGNDNFYYIWLQGIISEVRTEGGTQQRVFTAHCESGTLSTDEAIDPTESSWYLWDYISDSVTFLKEIYMGAASVFKNLKAELFSLGNHTLSGVAVDPTTPEDSEVHIATPAYVNSLNYSRFLRKDQNDSTPFSLGVGGNFNVNGNTDLDGNLNVDGVLQALARIITDELRSSNWTGDGPFDTGYQMYKDVAGVTHLTVDNLFVRMKAIFTELEIRKISYAGGNIIFSHAGSIVVAVKEIYDTTGLEFDGTTAKLSGSAGFAGTTLQVNANAAFDGTTLKFSTPEQRVVAYRCYLMADDGTTATENWWRVDDQARCQTFNIKEGVYQDVSNQFYWRRVMATGSEELEDGKTYDYVDLSVLDCIAGSTVPQAGDQIVQMGNRTDAQRQGFISIEVSGEDAPAFKVYKNVNSYSLTDKRKICISPKYTEIRANKIVETTETGEYPLPHFRTEPWYTGMQCYYYDVVQHNGSSWLCTYPDGGIGGVPYTTEEPSDHSTYWKIFAKEGKTGGEPLSVYTWGTSDTVAPPISGNAYPPAGWSTRITDRPSGGKYYLWMADSKKNSDGTIDAWGTPACISGADGTPGEDAKNIEFIYKYDANGYDGNTGEVNPSGAASGSDTNKQQDDWVPNGWYDRALPVTENNPDVYMSSRKYDASTQTWGAFGTPTLWGHYGSKGIDGDGVQYVYKLFDHELTAQERVDNIPQKPASPNPQGEWIPTGWSDDPQATTSAMPFCYCSIIKEINGVWGLFQELGLWGKWAEDGTSPYFADIDNEMESVACDSSGKTKAAFDHTVGVQMWHGSTAINFTIATTSVAGITITPNASAKNIRFRVAANTSLNEVNDITITLTAADGSGEVRTLHYVLNAVRAGSQGGKGDDAIIYSLVPSVSSVVRKKDGSYSIQNVSCTRQKNVGGTITDNTTDGTITYKIDGGATEHAYTNNTNIPVTDFTKSLQFIFRVDNKLVDVETIPLVADGTDGSTAAVALLTPQMVSIPTDADGKVLDDFRQVVPISLTTNNEELSLCSVRIISGAANVELGPAALVAHEGSNTVISGTTVVAGNAEYNGTTLVLQDGTSTLVPKSLIVKGAKGATITEHVCEIEVKGYDHEMNEYTAKTSLSILRNTQGKEGRTGDDGDDALNVSLSPENVILTQNEAGQMPTLTDANTTIIAKLGKVDVTDLASIVSATPSTYVVSGVTYNTCACSISGKRVIITAIDQHGTETVSGQTINKYCEQGYIDIVVRYNGVNTTVRFNFYCNLLGTWKREVVGDAETVAAQKAIYEMDDRGVPQKGTYDYSGIASATSSLQQWRANKEATYNGYDQRIVDTNNRVDSADQSIQTIERVVGENISLADPDGWEQGTTNGEAVNKTYAEIKSDSNYRIRTKELIPVTKDAYLVFNIESTYYVNILYFGSERKMLSSLYSGWKHLSEITSGKIKITDGSVKFVALLLAKSSAASTAISVGDISNCGLSIINNPTVTSSEFKQTADEIKLGVNNCGVKIDSQKIELSADKTVFKSPSGDNAKVWLDNGTGAIHAVDGVFSGKVTATSGAIGGFTIDNTLLTNSNWNAGIDITYDSKNVKIGKNAKGDMATENAIIRAENTKSGETYNTALYLNAANGTYNYAFYGQGNGVLNGYMQGYKVKVLNSIGGSNYLSLNNGMVHAVASVGIDGDKNIYLPTLEDCRKTLGIPTDNTKDFCCTIIVINQSAITSTTYNRDNVYVLGGSHAYDAQITSLSDRPVVLAQGNPKKLNIENCSMAYITITYINKRFIANYIKTTW